MANATEPLGGRVSEGGYIGIPAAAVKIIKGTLVCSNATGYATNAADTAGFSFMGVAKETTDNSGGAAGALRCELWTQGQFIFTMAGLTQADMGKAVFATDNQTLSLTKSTNIGSVGRIIDVLSATSALIELRPLPFDAVV